MKKTHRNPLFLGAAAMLVASCVPSGNAQIAIDEGFDDWSGSLPLWVDGGGTVGVQDLLIVLSNVAATCESHQGFFAD